MQQNAPRGCQAQPLKGISMLQGPFYCLLQSGFHIF